MKPKQLEELNRLTHRYIHGRITPKEMARYRELVKMRDEDALAKERKLKEKRGGNKA